MGAFLYHPAAPGDGALAFTNFTRSLQIQERLLQTTPDSAQAARDLVAMHLNLEKLSDEQGD